MTQSIYDKKTWLRHHIEEIIELQKNGLKQQQIIDVLRQSYGMPFEIEKSLW
jgi:cytochrome c-type biogenesis protein CcmH/NrfF